MRALYAPSRYHRVAGPVCVVGARMGRRCGLQPADQLLFAARQRILSLICLQYLLLSAAVLFPYSACGLGPHEILLLVNTNSHRSIEIGEEFARLRQVPACNIVYLSIPEEGGKCPVAISRDVFTKRIWDPSTEAIRDRGIGDHILAWVYSIDFPIRISASRQMSTQGITFLRNRSVDDRLIERGSWLSPLFSGPDGPKRRSFPSQSFDVASAWLGDGMPLPSMMLGYAGERGNSIEAITTCLRRGVVSDHSFPSARILFVTGNDVRAKTRTWQFEPARQPLANAGVSVLITNDIPAGQANLIGIMMGEATVTPERYGTLLPGSIADHLTSWAAGFDIAGQTKISAWIDAGATVSAGTVTEPMSIWSKFPSAWLYVHYVAGCTAIESVFQSVRCPLQLMVVGEPLACPWTHEAKVDLAGLVEGQVVSGLLSVQAVVTSSSDRAFSRVVFLLDGRTAPGVSDVKAAKKRGSDAIDIDTVSLRNGPHTLRVVAYSTGSVRQQVFLERAFAVRN